MPNTLVNIIYAGHSGNPSIHYQGPEGTVQVSNIHDPSTYNVYTHMIDNPGPKDCFVQAEPVVVRSQDFDSNKLKKFFKVFTWFKGYNESNKVEINYQTSLWLPSLSDLKSNPQWEERNNEIVIIANHKHSSHYASIYKLRTSLAEQLYNNGFKVSLYGHSRFPLPCYRGPINDKLDILKKVRFTICSENTYDELYSTNYLTEKLPHTIFAGCVPIYMGCYNIEDFGINDKSMIDLRKYVNKDQYNIDININDLINRIKNFSKEDYDTYRNEMYKERETDGGFFWKVSHEQGYQKMLRSVIQ
jgi:hypothetical protein